MRVLEFVAPGRLRLRETADLRVRSAPEAVVEPVAATTCDLDRAIVAGATPFPGPFDLGHECVARVVELGTDGTDGSGLEVGDLVVVPWHLSCGSCATCRAGRPSRCTTTERNAMYGAPLGGRHGGLLSEQVRVPYARSLVPVPAGLAPAAAVPVSDGMTDAYAALLTGLRDHPGEPVLVVGGLNHALYAAALAPALGAGPVTFVAPDERSRALAAAYGARVVGDVDDLAGEQFPVTIDASADPARLAGALRSTAPGGHCHSVGIYFGRTALPLLSMYLDAVTFTTGRPDVTPHAPAVLALIASGQVDPMPVWSEVLALADLPEALLDLPPRPLVLF